MDHTEATALPEAIDTTAERHRSSAKASRIGTELLTAGLGVGAIGLAGAALGAVCPLCVVVTPALLGLGGVQKLRALWLKRKAG
jgi:hypothetical protein